MWHRRFRFRFLAFTLGALIAQTLALSVQAQDETPSWNRTPSKEKKASGATTARPRQRARRPARPAMSALPLLGVQYRILKVERNGAQIEVNPITVFNADDRVRFSVKTDTDSYLYIIRQRDPYQPGKILFPDTNVNGGQNFVRRGQEFTVPSGCPQGTTSWDCAYIVGAEATQDFYTLVFSRNATLNLPPGAFDANGDIKPQSLRHHWVTSGQKLSEPQRGETVFSLRVRNLNRRANEELILRYLLNKRGRTSAGASN